MSTSTFALACVGSPHLSTVGLCAEEGRPLFLWKNSKVQTLRSLLTNDSLRWELDEYFRSKVADCCKFTRGAHGRSDTRTAEVSAEIKNIYLLVIILSHLTALTLPLAPMETELVETQPYRGKVRQTKAGQCKCVNKHNKGDLASPDAAWPRTLSAAPPTCYCPSVTASC